MFKTLVMATAAIAFLCGFAPAGDKDPGTGKDRPKPHKPKEGSPTTDMMVAMYKDGTMKAMYWVMVHENPKAGQYWVTKTSTDFGGMKMEMTQAWQVVKVDGDRAIIENDIDQGYIMAFEVDLKAELPVTTNVKKAWIGKVGAKAEEVQVMEPFKMPEGGEAEPPKAEAPASEEFKDLELGGGTWSGKKMTVVSGGTTSTVWTADKGWFGGVVKMETTMEGGSMTQTLSSHGENGEAWLKWDEAAKDEGKKEEPKKEEPKKDEAKPATPPEKAPEKDSSKGQ